MELGNMLFLFSFILLLIGCSSFFVIPNEEYADFYRVNRIEEVRNKCNNVVAYQDDPAGILAFSYSKKMIDFNKNEAYSLRIPKVSWRKDTLVNSLSINDYHHYYISKGQKSILGFFENDSYFVIPVTSSTIKYYLIDYKYTEYSDSLWLFDSKNGCASIRLYLEPVSLSQKKLKQKVSESFLSSPYFSTSGKNAK